MGISTPIFHKKGIDIKKHGIANNGIASHEKMNDVIHHMEGQDKPSHLNKLQLSDLDTFDY